MRGVKIVCTLGPASSERDTLRALVTAGMNVARLNFSHGTREEHRRRARLLREVSAELERPVAILQDLKGPKVRVGAMAPGSVLAAGEPFALVPGRGTGDRTRAFLDDPIFFEELQAGDHLLLADGAIELLVREVAASGVTCEVLGGGPLSSGKGVNAPRGLLRRPILSEEDQADLAFGVEIGVDLVGISYVRTPDDLRTVRRELRRLDASSPSWRRSRRPRRCGSSTRFSMGPTPSCWRGATSPWRPPSSGCRWSRSASSKPHGAAAAP